MTTTYVYIYIYGHKPDFITLLACARAGNELARPVMGTIFLVTIKCITNSIMEAFVGIVGGWSQDIL